MKLFYTSLFATSVVSSMYIAAAAQEQCVTCPPVDTSGDALVAASGGTRGTPKFCGYSADATGASGPQVLCFYSNSGGGFSSNNSLCPATASLISCS